MASRDDRVLSFSECPLVIVFIESWGHMKNTRRNTCTGARYAMLVRVNYINFGKTNTNPNPDPNRYKS